MKGTKKSLFDRPVPPPKKIRGFLGLPGELRNRIYEYYFEDGFRAELAAKGSIFTLPKRPTVKFCLPMLDRNGTPYKYESQPAESAIQTIRTSRILGRYQRVEGLKTNWDTSLCALILICKQVHSETVVFLYQNTEFAFRDASRITNFIDVVPTKNLKHITKLHLQYFPYGNPIQTGLLPFQAKHLKSWNIACKALSKRLTNLRKLEICVTVSPGSGTLSLRNKQIRPLLQFRRLLSIGEDNSDQHLSCPESQLDVQVQCCDRSTRHWLTQLNQAAVEMESAFGNAIARYISGWSEEDAMTEAKDVWDRIGGQYGTLLHWYEPVIGNVATGQ